MTSLNTAQIEEKRKVDRMDDPLDYLAVNYEIYCNQIYSLSISQPTEYYKMRNELLTGLNKKLLTDTHNIIFDLLRYGQIDEVKYTSTYTPSYPTELCNKISMDIAKAYQNEILKIIKFLLPPDNESLAKSSMSTKVLANSIDRITPQPQPTA